MKDIEKLLESMIYRNPIVTEDDSGLYFIKAHLEGRKELCYLDLEKSQNLEDAIAVIDEDFSKRSFFPVCHSRTHNKLFIETDEAFDEKLNLHGVSQGKMEKMTDTPYLGVFSFSDDESLIGYASRYGKDDGGYLSQFKLKDLKTSEEEVLFDDKDFEYRLGWGSVLFSKDHQKLIIACDYKSQRRRNNFLLFDRETKEIEFLLPESEQVSGISPLRGTYSEKGFFYVSDKPGTDSLYFFDLKTKTAKLIYTCPQDAHGFVYSGDLKTIAFSVSDRRQDQSTITLLKLTETSVLKSYEKSFPGTVYIAEFNKLIWFVSTTMTKPNTITAHEIDEDFTEKHHIPFYKEAAKDFLDFDYEYLEYDTFDGQKVPALLTLPKGEIKAVYIISFYGGNNFFSKAEATFAKHGIACLSPAVRGSWSYSKSWRDQIKGDLGGAEIVDLIWGAKFLEKRLGLPSSKIGLAGGSHGGYATLRALTFPDEFNGIDTRYDWGFGICAAGFADLEAFYKLSNIPDWLDDMLGRYKENIEKYKDRSPINHFERLKAPVRIEHGTNDVRVPYETIEPFVKKLEASDLPHEIMIQKDSGHTFASATEEAQVYGAQIAFISKYTS